MLLGQGRADGCLKYLEAVSDGKADVAVARHSVHAVGSIIGRPELMSAFITAIDRSAGLSVLETCNADELAAVLLMKGTGLDFDDALQYYAATKAGVEAIVSFDRHFDKTDLPGAEPADALRLAGIADADRLAKRRA